MPDHVAREQRPTGARPVPLTTIVREWGRIGCVGFGGPPAHIALLRKLCVADRQWLPPDDFEDGLAACNLLPGPASTQLAIFCAWRLRGAGAILGGVCFIVPGLVIILGLAALFLAPRPPGWIAGAAAGSGAAVPAVAVAAAVGLIPASWRRTGGSNPGTRAGHGRWIAYLVAAGRLRRLSGRGWLSFWRPADWPKSRRGPDPGSGRAPPGSSGPEFPEPGSSGPGSSGPGRSGLGAARCRWPPRCLPRLACSRWPGRASRSVLSRMAGAS